MGILHDKFGELSSKRAMGILYMIVGLLLAVLDQLTKHKISSFEVWVTVVLTGASLLGISLFEYFGKGKAIDKK